MRVKTAFPIILDGIKLWWADWANQVLVGLVGILLSLTGVLYPMASFGVYEQAVDLTHGIRTGIIGFWRGFKSHWRKSLPWGLLNLVVVALLGFNGWFYSSFNSMVGFVLMVLMGLLLVFWLVWQFYTISCYFLQEEKGLKVARRNGLAVILMQPGYAFLIGFVMLILLGLSVTTFIPLFLGSISLMCILGLRAVQATIKQDES